MKKTRSFSDQAWLTLPNYPNCFVVLLGPVMDSVFIKSLGKSKTYILLPGIVLAATTITSSFWAESMVQNSQVIILSFVWLAVSIFRLFIKTSMYIWSLTIVPKDQIGKVSIMINVGYYIGVMVGYNLFIPLNNKKWLNDTIFTHHPLQNEIFTHKQFYWVFGAATVIILCYIALFVKEKTPRGDKHVTIGQIFKQIPRIFRNVQFVIFLVYTALMYLIDSPLRAALDLKTIGYGTPIETMANLNTVVLPPMIVGSVLVARFVKKGSLMKSFFYIRVVMLLLSAHRLYIVLILKEEGYSDFITYSLLINFFLANVGQFGFYFWFTYLNLVADPEFGSTYFGIAGSIEHLASVLPTTFGLSIVEKVEIWPGNGFYMFCVVCLTLQAGLLGGLWWVAKYLDGIKFIE